MATFGQFLQGIFHGGGAAGLLPVVGPALGPFMPLGLLLLKKKNQCRARFPFNRAKREACIAAVDAQRASAAGGQLKFSASGAQPYATPSTVGVAYTTPAGMVVPLDASAIGPSEGGTMLAPAPTGVMGAISQIPWWAWLGAAGVGGYLLLRRRS